MTALSRDVTMEQVAVTGDVSDLCFRGVGLQRVFFSI